MASPREKTYLVIGGAFGATLTLLCTAKSEKAGRLLEKSSRIRPQTFRIPAQAGIVSTDSKASPKGGCQ